MGSIGLCRIRLCTKALTLVLRYTSFDKLKSMKRILLIGALMIGSHFFATAQTTYPSGVTGCISRWTFSSTNGQPPASLPDVSTNGHNASAVNLTAAQGFRNTANSALRFDGASSFAVAPHSTSLNPPQLTVVALIKPLGFYSGLCQGNNIIYKGFDYNASGVWAMAYGDGDNNCSAFNPTTERLEFVGGSNTTYPTGPFINTNKWYLLVTAYGVDTLKRYVIEMDTAVHNPSVTPVSATYTGVPLSSTTHDVRIGATQNPPYPYWFNGDMDEVVLFNKALTRAEVQSVYNYLWGYNPNSVVESSVTNEVRLWPTINAGSFAVSGHFAENTTLAFEVVDMLGRVIDARKVIFSAGQWTEKFDLKSIPAGTYFLRMTDGDGMRTERFVVAK